MATDAPEFSVATFNRWNAAPAPRGGGSSGSAVALTGRMCQARWVSGWWSVVAGVVVSRRLTRTHFEVVG